LKLRSVIPCNPIALNLFYELLEYLCPKYPELITDKMLDYCNYNRCTKLYKTLIQNYIDKDTSPDTDRCYICLSTYPGELIDCTCICKNKIHLNCLHDICKSLGDTCSTCNTSLKSFISEGRLLFPFSGIYKSPLMNHYIFLKETDLNQQLHFAIAYLCTKRVKQLLSTMSTSEFLNYKETADFYALHENKETLQLRDAPYTNLHRLRNIKKFSKIEHLLLSKLMMCYMPTPTTPLA
ncbi:MAG: hypothetical protein Gaeavirus1_1, partial [Gaeavirus sp.]